jgi:hypothetical protein
MVDEASFYRAMHWRGNVVVPRLIGCRGRRFLLNFTNFEQSK